MAGVSQRGRKQETDIGMLVKFSQVGNHGCTFVGSISHLCFRGFVSGGIEGKGSAIYIPVYYVCSCILLHCI